MLVALVALAYIVIPSDAIPDFVPMFGWLDDLGVVALALTWMRQRRKNAPMLEVLPVQPVSPSKT